MTNDNAAPFFSIVVPTRDRADLFELALKSVLEQTEKRVEIIVVNDGSTGKELEKYRAIEAKIPSVEFIHLKHRPRGHGQSYSMNCGAEAAKGDYLCFLDDDDFWIDPQHLEVAHDALEKSPDADCYYTKQRALFPDGVENTAALWLNQLSDTATHISDDPQTVFSVSLDSLLGCQGFAHLNCSIFRREFYYAIAGMDENIRYECDRDIYIRSLDAAQKILYRPAYVSQHHIPDQSNSNNMSTAVNSYQKRLYQLAVYDKCVLMCQQQEVRDFCRRGKGYELKRLVADLDSAGDQGTAYWYAKQAFGAQPTVRWGLEALRLAAKNLFAASSGR